MRIFFLLLVVFSGFCAQAQDTLWEELEKKRENDENRKEIAIGTKETTSECDTCLIVPEAWDTNLDNLLNSWYVKHYTNKLNHTGYQDGATANDSIYMSRLSKLPNIIELPYNDIVRNCINVYTNKRRDLAEYMLGMEVFYFPMIEEILDRYGLPLELKYLTIVESALNPTALSRAGASGLWQFILSTGKNYGLVINSLVDERRDPIKSTDAACRYLKDLYDTYGDWNLAIAAYNCGGGNVNKAIKRAGGKTDYWTIYPYLPRETRSYVPFFIAANYIMNYYAYHQLYPVQTSLPLSTDTVMVNQPIHFDQIAEVLQISKDEIRALNPQYRRDIIPGNSHPQVLKLPAVQAYAFVERENEIAAYRADELFTNRTYVEKSAASRQEKITHKVARGETVITIGGKYGVSAASIRKWNNLKSNKVPVGKSLVLYVDNGGYTASNTKSQNTTVKSNPKSESSTQTSGINSVSSITIVEYYKVKEGDSLYTIAQKYPGYSYADIMKLNNMTNSNLKIGQYIKVPKI